MLNRRQFALAMAAPLYSTVARGGPVRPYSAEMPDMLLAYLAARLAEQQKRGDAARARVRTPAQVAARRQDVRTKVRRMCGTFPEKPSLAARVAGTLERKTYRIENVLFQSRPDYWIPANVYVPAGRGPFPALVIQRGHFDAERMWEDYQQLYVDLASSGFVVLSYDFIGQGERRQQYESGDAGPNAEARSPVDQLLSPTLEHSAIGGLLMLIGESAAGWFVWDAMRAVDYLVSRTDVDRPKIGCADHTDTGWSSLYHAALDDRIQCASIHVRGAGRHWPFDRALWNSTDDPEQFLFPAALNGPDLPQADRSVLDLPDIMASLVPRPLQTLVEDPGGEFDSTAAFLRAQYALVQAADKFAIETARIGEDWPKALRLATVNWFRHHLAEKGSVTTEPEFVPERFSSLQVLSKGASKGKLGESTLGRPIYSLIRERAAHLPPPITPSGSELARLKNDIRQTLSLSLASIPLSPREVSSDRLEGYWLKRVEFLSEPGVYVAGTIYAPLQKNGECIVYVAGDVTKLVVESDDDDDRDDKKNVAEKGAFQPHEYARKGYTVLTVDVRGLGATQPVADRRDLRGPWEHLHDSDVALANMAWSLGDSLVAMRVRDLLRAVDFASQFGKVRLAGDDMGAVWAVFAASVDSRIASVAIRNCLGSFRLLTDHDRYMHAPSQFVPGILKRFDLPQVAGTIAPRPLTILNPVDHLKKSLSATAAEQIYSWTDVAYSTANASDRYQLIFDDDWGNYAIRD